MARRVHNIKVIIHPLDDVRSLELIQEATNDLYARIIENKLSTVDLSSTEKEYIVRQVLQKLMEPSGCYALIFRSVCALGDFIFLS